MENVDSVCQSMSPMVQPRNLKSGIKYLNKPKPRKLNIQNKTIDFHDSHDFTVFSKKLSPKFIK